VSDDPSPQLAQTLDPRWLVRGPLSRHLIGVGLDLGPGHVPFPTPYPGTRAWLVDRWGSIENSRLFPEPEMKEAVFPDPDVICDLATSSLDMFRSSCMDFVVASHIIEHVPNPIGLLEAIHRVLRPGAVLILLVPDRRRTFDRGRPPTTLDHVVTDYEHSRTVIDDAHVAESVAHLHDVAAMTEAERQQVFAVHRARSLHVHCWTPREFNEMLAYAIGRLGQRWDLVEAVVSDDWVPNGVEFGYVLRKSTVETSSDERRDRFVTSWADLTAHRDDLLETLRPRAPTDPASVDVTSAVMKRVLALREALRCKLRAKWLYDTFSSLRRRLSSCVGHKPYGADG
jgi:SAM-dependent methyltransferase